jgi:membrane protease YdiL (CAAX protease family)
MPDTTATSVEARRRARQGLAIYFAILVPLSAVVSAIAIAKGSVNWAIPAMAVPALASIVARFVLHEGFAEIGWRLRDRKVLKYIGLGLVLPIVVGSVAYGTAWAAGLAAFRPDGSGPRIALLAGGVVQAVIIVTLISWPLALGEEVGWRGYMLPRLINAGVPHPLVASGVIWGCWHAPLVLGGIYYADSPSRLLAAMLLIVSTTAGGVIYAWFWLDTRSIWPCVALHAAWNAVIGGTFDEATHGYHAELWVGESGILVTILLVAIAIAVSHAHAEAKAPPPIERRPTGLAPA